MSELDREIRLALADVVKLSKGMTKAKRKSMLRPAAKPLVDEAKKIVRAQTWRSGKRQVHYRYKGGVKVATYYPGNLARSIRVLDFKKSSDVFVGPKKSSKGEGTGVFKGGKVDGWYGHFLEFGSAKHRPIGFLRNAHENKKGEVLKIIEGKVMQNVREWSKKHWEKTRVANV